VVPLNVFLKEDELNSGSPTAKSTEAYLPRLCGAKWSEGPPRASAIRGAAMRPEETAPTEVPEAMFREAVVVYQSTAAAQAWMADLRQAVTDCPSEPTATGRGTIHNALVPDAPVTGEDWVVVHRQEPAYDFATGKLIDGSYDFYTASVRHGDTIVTFHTAAYENWGIADPARFYELVRIGAKRVADWRGAV
jgi:hypothetical protein